MTDASSSMTVTMRSRLIKAIHYEADSNRLSVLTTHNRLRIHEGVGPDVPKAIVEHEHPGYAYLALKHELGPRKSPYSLSGYYIGWRARRAIQQVSN